jgi:hypothetical protein
MQRSDLAVLFFAFAVAGCSESADQSKELRPETVAGIERIKALEADQAPAPASEFKPYESPDGLFRVNFPGAPKVENEKHFLERGRSKVEAYSIMNVLRYYTVRVGYYTEKRDRAKEIEDYIGRLMRRGVDAKLLDSRDIVVNGRPGKEITISSNGDVIHRARVFAGDMEFIQVSCELPDTEGDAKNGKAFIESFEFLK